MNKQRRDALFKIYEILEEQSYILEAIREEEEEAKDNMPENLQCSARYENAKECCGDMDEALSHINDALDCISSAINRKER